MLSRLSRSSMLLRGASSAKFSTAVNPSANKGPRTDAHGEPRFLENVKLFLERAAAKTDIPDDMYTVIESCASVARFNIPVRMDNGKIQTFACYRAQHSHHALPVKGGTRYANDMTL